MNIEEWMLSKYPKSQGQKFFDEVMQNFVIFIGICYFFVVILFFCFKKIFLKRKIFLQVIWYFYDLYNYFSDEFYEIEEKVDKFRFSEKNLVSVRNLEDNLKEDFVFVDYSFSDSRICKLE